MILYTKWQTMRGNILKHTVEKAKQMQTMRPCILSSRSFESWKNCKCTVGTSQTNWCLASLYWYRVSQKKLSLVDMLDVMDVMAKWKVVGVWKIIIFNLYVQIHKYNLFKYTNTLKYAPKYSLNFGEKWKKSIILKISFKLSI